MANQVKHQPATPLPYLVGDYEHGREIVQEGSLRPIARVPGYHDAQYLAHAANAYPKLVAALRGIALRHDDGSLCFDRCRKAGLQEPSPFCQRYQAILSDLGESA